MTARIETAEPFLPLRRDYRWRLGVWALRVGFAGLAVVLVGLLLLWSGGSPWVLATGMGIWLLCALLSATGFMAARRANAEGGPGFFEVRRLLLHDCFHPRP